MPSATGARRGLKAWRQDWLRGHVDALTRALPPAATDRAAEGLGEGEARVWWRRLFGR